MVSSHNERSHLHTKYQVMDLIQRQSVWILLGQDNKNAAV